MTDDFFCIEVAVKHYRPENIITDEKVQFKISRVANNFRIIPVMTREERQITGLPEKMEFMYCYQCISSTSDLEDESLDAIKEIILELEVRELL